MRYFLRLSYDGTNYCGWQVQANAPSVQQTINNALHKLLGQHISSMGCGRTDTGVHAKEFYMHFDAPEIADCNDFLFRLNCVLPLNITIHNIYPLHDKAHARFDATERTYEYFLHFHKSAFLSKFSAYQGFYNINWQPVLEATKCLTTTDDFTALCQPSEDFKTNLCNVTRATWQVLKGHHYILKDFEETDAAEPLQPDYKPQPGHLLRFTITSNRFLRSMVRKTVGTILMTGKGKVSVEDFNKTVAEKGTFRIHYLAPPNGLFLSRVKYPYLP